MIRCKEKFENIPPITLQNQPQSRGISLLTLHNPLLQITLVTTLIPVIFDILIHTLKVSYKFKIINFKLMN